MGKEWKSCVKEPEDPPLPWQVRASCSIMMEKSRWSLGLVGGTSSKTIKHAAMHLKSHLCGLPSESASPLCIGLRVFPWGISVPCLLVPLGPRIVMGITDVMDSFANLVRSTVAKRFSFMGVLFKLGQLGFPLFITGSNNCVFKMSKVKLSAEGDFTLFQATAELIKSAADTILN